MHEGTLNSIIDGGYKEIKNRIMKGTHTMKIASTYEHENESLYPDCS